MAQRHASRLQRIRELTAEQPCWGDRRLWAYVHFVERRPVNKKRVLRLMREHNLLVTPKLRLTAKRTPGQSTPQPTQPKEWWGIEMPKVLVQGFGWVSIVVVLACYTQMIVGHYVGLQGKASHGQAALDMAVNRQCPEGAQGQGLALMRDNGCQPTSLTFMKACRSLGIQQPVTSYHNPKGNADTERMLRTLKEACLGLHEWPCPCTFASALEAGMADYNEHYLHSALGYKPPRQFERDYLISHGTQFTAA